MYHKSPQNLPVTQILPANNNGGSDLWQNLQEDSYLYAFLELRYGPAYAHKILIDLQRHEANLRAQKIANQ